MKVAQGQTGRVFVLRFEDGDRLPDCIESFAVEHKVKHAFCSFLGAISGGTMVSGPVDAKTRPVETLLCHFDEVHEAAALGTLFPAEDGSPRLHMHAALGRDGHTITGCIRPGIEVWQIAEAVIYEIVDLKAQRRLDSATGFETLELD